VEEVFLLRHRFIVYNEGEWEDWMMMAMAMRWDEVRTRLGRGISLFSLVKMQWVSSHLSAI
jgi:hypothetical protein